MNPRMHTAHEFIARWAAMGAQRALKRI